MERKEYPFAEAVKVAAEQNYEHDARLKLVKRSEKEVDFPMYLEEAEYLLQSTGENYFPDAPDKIHIVLKV